VRHYESETKRRDTDGGLPRAGDPLYDFGLAS